MKKNLYLLLLLLSLPLLVLAQEKPIENPHIKWKFQSDAPIRGSVITEGDHIYFGNSAGIVYCLDKKTGKPLWQSKTGGAINSAPALANDKIIIANRDNFVYAINKTDGKITWNFMMQKVSPHTWGWDYYDATPIVDGKTVYIGSGDHKLYALNTDTGKPEWEFVTGDKIRASPLVQQDKMYVSGFDGFVYCLDTKTGKLLNKFETEGVGYYGKVYGWDRTSITSKPAQKDSLLVFGSRDGGLYCINKDSFRKKWRFSYGSSWVGSSPVIDQNTVFVGWSDQLVFSAIDLQTGKELWQYNCHAYVYSTPTFDSKNVYVGSFNGNVYGFDKISGKVNWEYQTGNAVLSSPVLENGVLYIGSDNGYLYAFEEGEKSYKAVYQPQQTGQKALLSDEEITPYLESQGYERLDTNNLEDFLRKRIQDKKPSVVVFAHDYLPVEVTGENANESLLKKYMEAGGKVVWLGTFPNYWKVNKDMNITGYDTEYASELLGVTFDINMDFGTYFATSTQKGCEWGLPKTFNSSHSSIAINDGIKPLALNELGRVAAFYKAFGSKPYSGFISFRSWSLMPIRQKDLETIRAIAELGL